MVDFNFTYDPNVTLEQRIGFEMAAALWSQFLTDDVTINLRISAVEGLNENQAVGGAVPIFHETSYGVYNEYLEQDITSENDESVFAALQDGNTVDLLVDTDGDASTESELVDGNTDIMLTRAQAKALGMEDALVLDDGNTWDRDVLEDPSALDGYIVINNSYDWNYDFTQAAAAPENTLDFMTMALHEIGHSLGFVSGLDGLLETFTMHSGEERTEGFTALDLLRYSETSATVENLDGNVSDLSFGGAAYFSLDGGATALAELEEGNEYQASHWQRFQNAIGIMDPTLGYQERTNISELDLKAFDVLGWDVNYDALGSIDLDALHRQAIAAISEDFGVGVAAIEGAVENGQDWYTLGYGSWWQAFQDQMLELGYGSWWQQFEADLLDLGYGSWWQAFGDDMLQLGYGSWWQSFEEKVLELGYGSWWSTFESDMADRALDLGYGSWWQQFEPQMLELSYGSWWQVFEQQMLTLGYGSWWQQFEADLLDLGYGSWWQAFEGQILELGYGSWWQVFEETVLELGYGSWWQEFEGSMLELGYGSWWQMFELGYGSWWQTIETQSQQVQQLDQAIADNTITTDNGTMAGGSSDDILVGGNGQDFITGNKGDDLIDGKEGNDIALGGEGNDIIYGWHGNDILLGGEGDDVIAGENGDDKLFGEDGHDILSGGRGEDFLDGGAGRDVLKGDTDNDVLDGGSGDDLLSGGSGDDLLIGGTGQDELNGGDGDDILYGDHFVAPTETTDQVSDQAPPEATDTTFTDLNFWTRIEAEDMDLKHYDQDEQAEASGGSVVVAKNTGSSASAKTTFNGLDGTYDLVLGYYNDVKGSAEIEVVIKDGRKKVGSYKFQLENKAGLGSYKISDIVLESGYKIEIKSESDDNDLAQFDYLDILTSGTTVTFDDDGNTTGDFYQIVGGSNTDTENSTILVEAESLQLDGYETQTNDAASGNTVIINTDNQAGTATYTYNGESGQYNLYANYFDSSSGKAQAAVSLNGQTLTSWQFRADDNASHERTIGLNITLNQGDVIEIQGKAHQNDLAMIDSLVLEDVSGESGGKTGAEAIRVEAEAMTLEGEKIKVKNKNHASGGSFVQIDQGDNLTATTAFTGETGYYDITVGYYDRKNGVATYNLNLAGAQIDNWMATQDFNSLNQAAATRVLKNVLINKGDSLSVQSTRDGNDRGYLDYVEFAPAVGEAAIQLEVEDMDLSGRFGVKSGDFAQAGSFVETGDNATSFTGTSLFSGETGYYNIVVGYFDSNKGDAEIAVSVDNKELGRWYADQNSNSGIPEAESFTTYTVAQGIKINELDLIEITGIEDNGDKANIDYIKFIAVDAPQVETVDPELESPLTETVVEEAGNNDDVLRGGAGNDTAYGGYGNDIIYGDAGNDTLYGDFETEIAAIPDFFYGSDFDNGPIVYYDSDYYAYSDSEYYAYSDSDYYAYSDSGYSYSYSSGYSSSSEAPNTLDTLTFQQGMNGYNGTVDTYIDEYYGSYQTGFDTHESLGVDSDYGGYELQSLIRFDNLFGTQASQIGQGDDITSAILELKVHDSGDRLMIYEMLQSWTGDESWNYFNNGIQANGVEAANTPVSITDWVQSGTLRIDVTASLRAWQADPSANKGWAFLPTGSDGVDFYSSESGLAPKLVVDIAQSDSFFPDTTIVDPASRFFGDEAIVIDHSSDMLLNNGTLSFSFQADSVSQRQGLLSKDSMYYGGGGHITMLIESGTLIARLQSTNATYELQTSINASEAYDVAVTFGTRGFELWLNGELSDYSSYTGGLGTNSGGYGNYEPIVLGANQWASSDLTADTLQNYFSGTLQDVRLHDQQLGSQEIFLLPTNSNINANSVFEALIATPANLVNGESSNDQLIGGSGDDSLYGGEGNDILLGTDELSLGVGEIDTLIGGSGADQFILGDINSAYYHQGGFNDYAVIEDFDAAMGDSVQLHGSVGDYTTEFWGNGTGLYRQGDAIAFFTGVNNLNLTGQYFQYVT